jgi:1-acyl-sn-glycerol-3-phosphate acyltransferase
MTQFFLKIYDWLIARKSLAALLLGVVVALSVCFILRLHYKEDIADFLPKGGLSEKYSSVYGQMGGQNKIAVIFSSTGKDGDEDLIVSAVESFGRNFEKVDTAHTVKDIQLNVDESAMFDVLGFVGQNYPYFMTEADYSHIDSLLSKDDYIASQLEADKQMLMLPTGNAMVDNIRYDPVHLFTPVLKRLQSFKVSDRYTLYDGCLFTDNGRKGLAFLTSPYGISESDNNEKLATMIDSAISRTEGAIKGVKITAVGAPLIAVTNAKQIKSDSILAISLSVILIFALLFVSFRRLSDLLWIAFSLVLGWILALGAMALFKDSISIIVLGIGSVIIGIAVNYPLHYLDHLKHEPDKRKALKEMAAPLLIGNITTVSAFLSLAWMNSKAMRDLGLFGSLVLVATILFVLIFLPVFVRGRKETERRPDILFGKLSAFNFERKKIFLLPVILITMVLGWFSLNTSFDSDMRHINYMTAQQREDMELLNSTLNKQGYKRIFAVAEGENMDKALQQNEKIQTCVGKLISQRKADNMSGIGNFVPSIQKQETLIRRWNDFWKDKRHAGLADQIKRECVKEGFSADAFTPFYEMMSYSFQPQTASYFEPIISHIASQYVAQSKGCVRIVNFVQAPAKDAATVKTDIRKTLTSTKGFAFDEDDIGLKLVNLLSNDFNYVGYVCGFIVFFFLWLSFGRIELSLLSFLPLAVSWIWILGIMQIGGIQFNIVNIILATFIFGQGDDYTIFITEGMMYEYAYGKKMLASYKSSVALSALIMFIGIGTLIFARHPAMRSLAEVTIIGMFTVVLMAYYLPPLLFRWITVSRGQLRQVPLTFKRLTYSLFALLFFLFGMFLFFIPFTYLYFHFGKDTERKKLRLHRMLCSVSGFVIRHVPGVKFSFSNQTDERFDRPAVIICNHQSHLDLMCLMMLTPKLIFITKDWVWHNPFYGYVIRKADYYPASNGIDENIPRIRQLVERGYSVVIFPEGTRSEDCRILRFHKGAFYLAEQLGIDILPIFIHGVGHVLPKKDFMLRSGSIHVEIDKRICPQDTLFGEGYRERTSKIHKYYISHYAEICNRQETAKYFLPYVEYKYMYKGHEVEKSCRRILRQHDELKRYIDNGCSGVSRVSVVNSGNGELAWLMALVNKDVEVLAYERDEEKYSLASHCSSIPQNLHFIRLDGQGIDVADGELCYVINPTDEDKLEYTSANVKYIQI